jgi:DNA-binding IclR family transcriptional regulator
MLPAQPNQSLIDGLEVLQAVSACGDAVGSRELARRLDLEPTRVNRLLKTLAAIGLLQQSADRRYRPGSGLHVLAATALFGSQLIARSVRPIEKLRSHCPRLTVALGVRWRSEVAYLLFAKPGVPLAEAVGRTALYPALRSSIGRVLLAGAPDAEIESLYGKDAAEVHRHAVRCRRQGYALLTTEPEPTLAVPIGPLPTATAALALAGAFRPEQTESILQHLRQAASEIHAATEPQEPT